MPDPTAERARLALDQLHRLLAAVESGDLTAPALMLARLAGAAAALEALLDDRPMPGLHDTV